MHIPTAMLLASVSLAAICHQAAAEDGARDSQIRVAFYSPLKRTEIVGVVGQPTTITFPRGESIYRVVQTGKSDKDGTLADAGWQGAAPAEVKDTPLGNNLTLWPAVPGVSTMSVITMSSEGSQKVYPFRLIAKPDEAGAANAPGVVLNLIFNGPAAPTPASLASVETPAVAGQTAKQRAKQAELEAAQEHLRTDAFNGAEGLCHYIAKGHRACWEIGDCGCGRWCWNGWPTSAPRQDAASGGLLLPFCLPFPPPSARRTTPGVSFLILCTAA